MATAGIKICGIRTRDALDAAINGGASHVGLVFVDRSPRHVEPAAAAALAAHANGRVRVVGLFVDAEPGFVAQVAAQVPLDVMQFHGREDAGYVAAMKARNGSECWKAIGVRKRSDLSAAAAYRGIASHVLYDAKPPEGGLPGGTGLRIDWGMLRGAEHPIPWILAGGLDAANVAEAIHTTGAPFVDVSSGVESEPGVKDNAKIAAFCRAVHET
jgi:phosphoribosylanthranilate isomerase